MYEAKKDINNKQAHLGCIQTDDDDRILLGWGSGNSLTIPSDLESIEVRHLEVD